jgi:hypothetical protein
VHAVALQHLEDHLACLGLYGSAVNFQTDHIENLASQVSQLFFVMQASSLLIFSLWDRHLAGLGDRLEAGPTQDNTPLIGGRDARPK